MTRNGRVDVEFLIEPFVEGAPGEHVQSAIAAVEAHGLEVEVGPFGNVAKGDVAVLSEAMSDMARAAIRGGADRVTVTFFRADAQRSSDDHRGLRNALDRIIWSIEIEMGARLEELDRSEKQAAVRLLDESGAFLLRRSIEDVAERMGVSRITIYNYLNAMRGD